MNIFWKPFEIGHSPASTILAAALVLACARPALGQSLQGQSKADTNWTSGNVQGWAELDYIPMRVYFAAGSAGSHTVTINFPHLSGKLFAFEDLSGFAASTSNCTFTSAPTLIIDSSGNWSYVFTASISDNNPAEVRFFARMASGAHLYGGSSLQLKGSAGNVMFHKPAAAAGAPDLAVSATGPATAPCGSPVIYTLGYTNKAPSYPAVGAQLTVILAPELVVNPASLGTNAHIVGNTIFWDLGNLAAGAAGSITFQASVSPLALIGAVMTNSVQIYSSENDANTQDNSAVILTSVVCGGTAATIVANPTSVTVCPGESALFSATATGSSQLAYQWRKNGVTVAGATSPTLTIGSVSSADAGSYDVLVTSPCDTVVSAAADLTLRPGLPLNLAPGHFEPDGSFVISFGTDCGGTYFVEYTEDLVVWKTSPQTAPGNGMPVEWRDSGQPVTDSMPDAKTARFYRVLRVF